MHRFRSWTLDPPEYRTQRNRLLPIEGGDGSTLNLDFTTGVLDPRINFQRTTVGTFYRGRFNQNRFFPSEDQTTLWVNNGILAFGSGSVANDPSVAAPNGTFTADKMVENTALGDHRSYRSVTGLQAGQVFTASVYLKAAGRNQVALWETQVGGTVFNLSDGTVSSNSAGVTSSIEAAGNGWYRCSITLATVGTSFTLQIRGAVSGNVNYTGNGTSGWYVWGAQLTEGSLLTPYIPTTTAAITEGQIASSQPWNLLLRSQEFNLSPWSTVAAGVGLLPVITADDTLAPDGTMTADKVVFDAVASATANRSILQQSGISLVSGSPYTQSVWIKGAVGGEQVLMRTTDGINYNLMTATTDWQRIQFTSIASAATSGMSMEVRPGISGCVNTNATVWLWGAQLNAGPAALDYRSTTSSALWLPRFENDPVTGEARGLLIEGGATNLTRYSEDLSQVSAGTQWYGAKMNTPTVPGGAPNSPYGTTAASWKLIATAEAGYHAWRFAVPYTAADYTFSFWAKAAEYDRIVLSDAGSGRGACLFVLTGNGTATAIAGTVTPTNPTIVKYDNGWYRCSVTMTMTAATYGMGIVGYPAATTPTAYGASYTADGTSGVYATMFQTELGSGASSYIPTGASQGTRNADECSMTGTNFSSWFNSSEGTFTVRFQTTYSGQTTLASYILALDNSASKRIVYMNTSAETAASYDGVTIVGNVGDATGVDARIASAYSTTGRAFVLNGGAVSTGTVAAGYSTATSLAIGSQNTSAHFRQIKFYPTRLPNAQLQSLTT